MKLKELEKTLKSHKCETVREGGNHTIWKNPKNNKISAVPRHKEIKENLAKAIFKQLDLSL